MFATVTDSPDLFGGVDTVTGVGVSSAQPNKDKTARIAGMALSPSPVTSVIQQNTEIARKTIETMGDASLRLKAAGQQQVREMNAYSDLISQNSKIDPTLTMGAVAASQQSLAIDLERRATYALESEAINRIQDLAATGDATQARLLLNNLEHGDANQVIRDMNTKQLILEREINKIADATDGDWLGAAANFMLNFAPIYQSGAELGNVDIDKGLKGFGDWFWSGRRMTNESAALWSIPVHEFSDYVSQNLLPNIKKHSTFLGFQDKTKELSILSQLNRPQGVIAHNAWGTVANLGFLGPAELKGAVSIPGVMIRNGARKEATSLVRQAALDIMTKGSDEATKATGLQAQEVIDHMLPGAVNPATVYTPTRGDLSGIMGTYGPGGSGKVPMTRLYRGEQPFDPAMVDPGVQRGRYYSESESVAAKYGKVSFIDVPTSELDTIAPKTEAAKAGQFDERIVDLSKLNPTPPTQGVVSAVSIAGDVTSELEKTQFAIEEFTKLTQLGRMTDAETQAAVDATINKINNIHSQLEVKDVTPSEVSLSDSTTVHKVEFTLGSFETEEQAADYAASIGRRDSNIIRDDSGIYSIRTEVPVTETGAYTDLLNPKATGFLARFVLNSRLIGDSLLGNMAQSAGNTRAKLLRTLSRDYAKVFSTLPGYQREATGQVLAAGENLGKWFTRDQREALYERMWKRPPTTAEHEAYETAVKLNDIEYGLRNDEVYKTKFIQGYESVSFDSGIGSLDRGNARVVADWDISTSERAFNLETQVHYSKANPITDTVKADLREQGYVMVTLDQPLELRDGTVVKAVLAKPSKIKIESLRRDQIGYRQGGHRIYEGKYFAKQARIGAQPDGEKFFKNPNTYIVGKTKAEVDYWVNRMEQARLAFLDGASASELNDILPPYIRGEEFISNMENKVFEKDQPFRTMYDREDMPEYHQSNGWTDMRDIEESNVESYLRTNGRLYYSGKGETLRDWQGAQAPTFDPFKTINQSLMNVANLSSMSDYKLSAAERWQNTFGTYLSHKPTSPMDALRNGVMDPKTPEFIRQQAEAQRDVIKRTLGWRTEYDRQKEIYGRRFAEWVGGDDPYSIRDKATAAISTWWNNNNPVQALRGAAFDLKLGLFNVAQLPLQIGTLVAATTLNPKYGFQGMVGLVPLRTFLTKSGTDKMLDTFIERGTHTAAGFSDAAEYKLFMNSAKESGFFDIGGTHLLINDYGPNAAAGILSSEGALRQAGRFWFNEGEVWNRAVAWRIAWGEAKDKGLTVGSKDFQREVAGRAEDYAFGMSEQSAAYWQKGLLSIPTQFWAYNARMLEAMLGKTFTPQQRARLIIGQTLMFGSAGIPMAPYISEQIKKHNGEAPSLDSVYGFMDRGLLDEVIYHATGADIQVSARYGTGSFWTDTIKDMFGSSAFGEKSFMDVAGGATWSIGKAGFETLIDVAKYAAAESGAEDIPLTENALMRLASNISLVSNLHKAYLVHQYGTLMTNKGTTIASGIPSQSAWAVALGMQPGEVDQVSAMMGYLQDNKDAVEEVTKVITNYRARMINEPQNRADIYEEMNAYIRLQKPDIKIQAMKKAQGRFNPSLLDGITTAVQRDRVRAETLNQMENNGASDSNPE